MPNPEFRIPEIPEPGASAGQPVPNANVEAQIHTGDVSSAHQFFTAKAGGGPLPDLTLHGDAGASASIGNATLGNAATGNAALGHAALGNAGIGQAVLAKAAIGNAAIGNAAIGALATPGAEPISPLVQLILKMPGFSGMMNSFFEFLGSLFSGNLIEAFNPAHWADQVAGALAHASGSADHFAIPLHFMEGGDSPLLVFNGDSFHSLGMPSVDPMRMHTEMSSAADAANVGSPVENVDLEQAIFEKTSNFQYHDYTQNSVIPWHQGQQMAVGPEGDAYKPGLGGYYSSGSPSVTTTQTAPTGTSTPTTHPTHHASDHSAGHHAAPRHFRAQDITTDRTQIAQTSDAPAGDYTVQTGDNLWDIARQRLGDGSRWGDIYKMNADAIGQNPDLIHPGTALKMPDAGTNIASADKYIVQPGDNLWSISNNHLGGGQHWGNLYHANEGVIGGNPRLIMPGQELHLGGVDSHIASVTGATPHHAISIDHSHAHVAHAHAPSHHHPSHSPAASHHVAHSPTAADGHIASHPAGATDQHIAMAPGANAIHGAPTSTTASASAHGVFKEQTPVLAPVDAGAAGPTAGSGFTSSAPTSYTGSNPSLNES